MRISDTGVTSAAERHICAFPGVLGTGMIITSEKGIPQDAQDSLRRSISGYEAALSRFLPYSLVRAMGDPQGIAEHNGIFEFPEYCRPLFDIYDSLYEATDGRINPCIGESLIRLGYSVPFDLIGNGLASSGPVGTARAGSAAYPQEPLLPDSIPQAGGLSAGRGRRYTPGRPSALISVLLGKDSVLTFYPRSWRHWAAEPSPLTRAETSTFQQPVHSTAKTVSTAMKPEMSGTRTDPINPIQCRQVQELHGLRSKIQAIPILP